MKASIEMNIKPFRVPNNVIVDEPHKREELGADKALPLSTLDAGTLEKMCEDFTAEVFKKAGKARLPKPASGY